MAFPFFGKKKEKEDFSDLDLSDLGMGEPGAAPATPKAGMGPDTTQGLGGTADLGPLPGTPSPAMEPQAQGFPSKAPSSVSPLYPQAQEQRAPMPPPAMTPQPLQYREIAEKEDDISKDLEIISAKLDSIRASLENLNHRMANLERAAGQQSKYSW